LTILGIDPGVASIGYGVIKIENDESVQSVDFGVIQTSAEKRHEERLKIIYSSVLSLIENHRPDAVAIESVFFSKNLKSLAQVSEAIGVITLAAGIHGLSITKFTPFEVKSSIVGFGRAEKRQVKLMIKNMLNLPLPPKHDHASDALAIALCYKNIYL
jgi:crossover junction endodeoxyribonuclease RuvC